MLSMRGILIGLQDALAAQRPTVTAISDTEDFLPFNLVAEPAVKSSPEAAARDQQHSASTSGPDDLPWATDVSLASPLLRLHHGTSHHSCPSFSAAPALTWLRMIRMSLGRSDGVFARRQFHILAINPSINHQHQLAAPLVNCLLMLSWFPANAPLMHFLL